MLQLGRELERLRPTIDTGCLFEELDPERVIYEAERRTGHSIGAVTADLDGTQLPHFADRLSKKSLAVVSGLVELVPFGNMSNAGDAVRDRRARDITADTSEAVGKEIELVTSFEFNKWLAWLYGKPFRYTFDKMADRLDRPNRRILHLGDQLFKDSLGANEAGYAGSVHVETCAPEDDPSAFRKYAQLPAEEVLLAYFRVSSLLSGNSRPDVKA